MTPPTLDALAFLPGAVLGEVFLKASVMLGLTAAALVMWRRASAATRHAVWGVGFAALLSLPVLSYVLPAWRIDLVPAAAATAAPALPAVLRPPTTPRGTAGRSSESDPRAVATPSDMVATTRSAGVLPGLRGMAAAAVLVIWLTGVAVLLARFFYHTGRIHGMTRRARPCHSRGMRILMARTASRMGIGRRVRLLVSGEISGPVTWGVARPVVLLPEEEVTWSTERKRVVLLHELAHIARWDYAALVVAEVARALYWLNPLVWFAARAAAHERERASDDLALRIGVRSDVYASHLIDMARSGMADLPQAAFAMARRSSLASRLYSILSRDTDRAPVGRRRLLGTVLVAVLVAVPVAAVEIRGAQTPATTAHRVDQLGDADPLTRRYAAWALGELEAGDAVLPLIALLSDGDPDVRLVSAWSLGEIKDPEAIPALIERLDDDDPLVREMAVLALGEIEHGSAIDAIVWATSKGPSLVAPGIWALGEIGKHSRHAREQRSELMARTATAPHGNAEVWTGRLTRPSGSDIGALTSELAAEDPTVRQRAAEALGRLDDERAVSPLLDRLRDPEPVVRAAAIWALDEINPSRREAADEADRRPVSLSPR